MNITSKKKNLLVVALLGAIIISGNSPCFAKKNEKEEKSFTEAHKLDENNLEDKDRRSYDEGYMIKSIVITGNNLVGEDKILNTLQIKQGEKFDRLLIQKSLKNIYNMGYFTEKLKVQPKASASGITLNVQVEENAPVTGFNVTGNTVLDDNEIYSVLNKQLGLPQNITALNYSVKEIEDKYAEKGYILARVKRISDDPDGVISIDINEGVINNVKIAGNTKTKDFVIKRNILVESGKVYNENILKNDLTRLYGTQSFADVRRVISPSDEDPDKYNLTIEVDEKRTGSISFGGGVGTGSGLFGSVAYMDKNFLGRGQEISIATMVGSGMMFLDYDDTVERVNIQFDASFLEPRFKQTLNSLKVSMFGREYASFQVPLGIERRFGSQIEVARPFKSVPNMAGSIGLGFENVKVKEGDYDEAAKIFSERGISMSERAGQLVGGSYISLSPTLAYDTRNSFSDPTSGLFANISFNNSFLVSGSADTYGLVTGTVRKFYPVGERSTFTIGAKAGARGYGTIPEFASFRLGGATTIRGFLEGDVGNGTGYMMGSAEFRTPIPFMDRLTKIKFFNNIKAAFFLDAGTLFDETLTSQLYERPGYAITTGMGLRVLIPGMGPIKVDYGFPLANVGPRNNKHGRFNFGFGERY